MITIIIINSRYLRWDIKYFDDWIVPWFHRVSNGLPCIHSISTDILEYVPNEWQIALYFFRSDAALNGFKLFWTHPNFSLLNLIFQTMFTSFLSIEFGCFQKSCWTIYRWISHETTVLVKYLKDLSASEYAAHG